VPVEWEELGWWNINAIEMSARGRIRSGEDGRIFHPWTCVTRGLATLTRKGLSVADVACHSGTGRGNTAAFPKVGKCLLSA
jgi:hypothetical protein